LVITLSFVPEASIPQIHTDASGMFAEGNAAFDAEGTAVAAVVNVRTPVDDTLNCVTGLALKLNANGIV
jgi:hypothetical protein